MFLNAAQLMKNYYNPEKYHQSIFQVSVQFTLKLRTMHFSSLYDICIVNCLILLHTEFSSIKMD